jgi:Ca2+-binding EF-hand superfamily protein
MSAMTEEKRPRRSSITRVKKSETLEVRIPYETKQAFLTACREDGTTASEVVRESVHTYLDGRERPTPQRTRTLIMKFPKPVRRYGMRVIAGSAIAAGFTALVVLPSAAAPDFAAIFKMMDANGDGALTAEEFAGTGKDGDRTFVENRTTKIVKGDPSAAPPPGVEVKQDAFAFWLPEDGADGARQQVSSFQHREVYIKKDGDAAAAEPQLQTQDIQKVEFAAFDTNKDGKVSLSEFQARHRTMLTRGFEILDGNKDGSLTQAEYAKIMNPPIPALGGAGAPPVPATPIPPGDGPKISADALKANFTKLDANKDNKLSLQEYLPPA